MKKGLSQYNLALLSGVSLRSIQDYEQGQKEIRRACAINVYNIASVLGVTIEELLELEKL